MNTRTAIALGVTMVLWASSFVGIRAGLQGYGPGHLALLRFLSASAVLAAYALIARMRIPKLKDMPTLALHGFLGFSAYHVLLNYGEQTVSAASACFLIGGIPLITTILAVLVLGERLSKRSACGLGIGFAGVGLIAMTEGGGLSLNVGALFILAAAFSESLFMVLQKPLLSRYTPLEYVSWTLWAGTFFMLVFLPGLEEAVANAPAEATWAAVYLGVFPAALAYYTNAYALARAPVSLVAAVQFTMPGVTIILGWIWLGEWPAITAVVGGLIALTGVGMIVLRRGKS